MQKNSYRN